MLSNSILQSSLAFPASWFSSTLWIFSSPLLFVTSFSSLLPSVLSLCSWDCERAVAYRTKYKIPNYGTAVNVVRMVYGNMNNGSGTGVLYVFLFILITCNADIVAGFLHSSSILTPFCSSFLCFFFHFFMCLFFSFLPFFCLSLSQLHS